jgi:hypothetical protein
VTIPSGQRALVAWNGSDFVQVGASAGGSNTQVQFNSNGALAGSANLTFDGTTLTANAIADSSLTSGRVTYAGASGNLTDSANLTFDGTTLTANDIVDSSLTASKPVFTNGSNNLVSTGTVPTDQGGTGLTSFTSGGAVYATSTSALTTGTLPVTAGGTGIATATAYALLTGGTTSTGAFQQVSGTGTSGQILTSNGAGALPTWQTPAASGATKGQAIAFAMIFGG